MDKRTALFHGYEGAKKVLLIPDGLTRFFAARMIMGHRRAGIFHKRLDENPLSLEFFSNAPCLAYVTAGCETFIDPDGDEITVKPNGILLVPRHFHMVSEYSGGRTRLEAYLFFFNDLIIHEFLAASGDTPKTPAKAKTALFDGAASLQAYVAALPDIYDGVKASPALVKTKLLELLHLIHLQDKAGQLTRFLLSENARYARRNIKQIMKTYALVDLSVADYAKLSGRSVSSFQRDFKRTFGEAPSVWLRRARLEHAREKVLHGREPISVIAEAAGFADTSHFIKAYKNMYDDTPKQHRLRVSGSTIEL